MPKSIIYKWFKLIILINKQWLLLLNGRIDMEESISFLLVLTSELSCLLL